MPANFAARQSKRSSGDIATTMKRFLQNLLGFVRGNKETAAAEDSFLQLIRVANENEAIKQQLVQLLRQPPFQRKSSLSTWISRIQLEGAPPEFVAALGFLLDDSTADRALAILDS